MFFFRLIFIFCIYFINNYIKCVTIEIKLSDNNRIFGERLDFNNKLFDVFLGIPYAKAPVGELRFKKPVPIDEISDTVYNATELPSPCINYNSGHPSEMPWSSERTNSEDCLYLNIWSPKIVNSNVEQLHPVMIWIYGGAFQTGSIDLDLYDGRALATTGNVVVVTFNYRTGVLGLFYSGTDDAPGNVALHDQRLALQWVNKYIDKFGGDPNSVTIFGESAGSISAGIHLLSSMNGKLFNRAILQSGSPYHNIGGVNPDLALFQSKLIAKDANCLTSDEEIDFNCMRNLSTADIKRVYNDIYSKGIALQLIFGDEISPIHPIHTIDAKIIRPIDVIIGTNKDEGSSVLFMGVPQVFSRIEPMNLTKAFAIEFIRAQAKSWWLGVLSDDQISKVVDFYMFAIDDNDYEGVRQSLVDLIGDSMFVCPSIYLADGLSQISASKVFYYQFTHIKHFNNYWGKWMGSPHFDDVQYVFGNPLRYPLNYSDIEKQLSLNLMLSWSSFAWKGEPVNTFGDDVWPSYEPIHRHYIEINGDKRNSYLKSGPRIKECQFWKQFFENRRVSQHNEL